MIRGAVGWEIPRCGWGTGGGGNGGFEAGMNGDFAPRLS
jgi:hypothetical protein